MQKINDRESTTGCILYLPESKTCVVIGLHPVTDRFFSVLLNQLAKETIANCIVHNFKVTTDGLKNKFNVLWDRLPFVPGDEDVFNMIVTVNMSKETLLDCMTKTKTIINKGVSNE